MDKRFPHPFSKLVSDYRTLRAKMPMDVSLVAENQFKENFRRQGYESSPGMVIPWRRTKKKENTFGKKSKGILIGSGRLKRSLRKNPDFYTARVTTDVPYAQIHNEGGVISSTHTVRSHKRGKANVRSFRRKVNIKMPRRSFMMHTKGLEARIEKYMDKELEKLWNKA